MKPRAFHPEADEEYANAAEYYTRIEPELGQRFHDEIERLILDIRRQSERFGLFDPPNRLLQRPTNLNECRSPGKNEAQHMLGRWSGRRQMRLRAQTTKPASWIR